MQTSIGIGSAYYNGQDWLETVDFTQEAEKLGVNHVWSAEAWGMDAVVPLAYLAAKTDKIKLGTGIMQITSRAPSMTAMTSQSMRTVSDNRFILGLGVSGPQVVEGLHGADFAHPLARLRECLEIIKLGLNGERISYQGKHYELPRREGEGKAIRLSQPPCPNLPIYLATLGPKSLELTGELANGWLGTSFIPEHAHVFFDHIKKGLDKAGRSWADIDIQVGGGFEVGDDVERMIEARKPGMAFQLGGMGSANTNFYNDTFRRAGYVDEAIEVQRLWVDRKRDEAAKRIPDEMILKTNIIGTPEMIRERLDAFKKVGVTTLRLGTGGNDHTSRIDKLAEALDIING